MRGQDEAASSLCVEYRYKEKKCRSRTLAFKIIDFCFYFF
jgi:hypothetical protein